MKQLNTKIDVKNASQLSNIIKNTPSDVYMAQSTQNQPIMMRVIQHIGCDIYMPTHQNWTTVLDIDAYGNIDGVSYTKQHMQQPQNA